MTSETILPTPSPAPIPGHTARLLRNVTDSPGRLILHERIHIPCRKANSRLLVDQFSNLQGQADIFNRRTCHLEAQPFAFSPVHVTG